MVLFPHHFYYYYYINVGTDIILATNVFPVNFSPIPHGPASFSLPRPNSFSKVFLPICFYLSLTSPNSPKLSLSLTITFPKPIVLKKKNIDCYFYWWVCFLLYPFSYMIFQYYQRGRTKKMMKTMVLGIMHLFNKQLMKTQLRYIEMMYLQYN